MSEISPMWIAWQNRGRLQRLIDWLLRRKPPAKHPVDMQYVIAAIRRLYPSATDRQVDAMALHSARHPLWSMRMPEGDE